MKVIREGVIPPNRYEYMFECNRCHSVIQASLDEMKNVGSQYNESYYEFRCPFCRNKETTSDSAMKKVGVYE